jgi:putative ABC transport system ATP-binding protein
MTTATVPLVSWEGVGRTYDGEPPVDALRPTDLVIERGEYVSVTGRSGSGKSTLLHVLGLLDAASTGTYRLGGIDVGGLDDARRSVLRGRFIGFVFQAFHLVPYRTALENVTIGALYQGVPRRERDARASRALEQVGLSHRRDFLPRQLSGGEQQRVAIARALAAEPELLLADEPTGNLDSTTAASVLDVFERLHADAHLTVLVITHDRSVSDRAGRRLDMLDGEVR